jgi:CRISPR-associated endoribonuclease Cas6
VPPQPPFSIRFEFYRFRFHFRAVDPMFFPAGKSGNVIRGALGMVLRDTASPADYARLFEPGSDLGKAPSGLADWPRPFVLRAEGLDGRRIAIDEAFSFDVHVFDLRAPVLAYFRDAFAAFGAQGIGPGHGRVALERVEQLDLEDAAGDPGSPPLVLELDPPGNSTPLHRLRVRFLTPTELKHAGALAKRPEFPILFGRLRDRISTLRSLYGAGPLAMDFREAGERAAQIRMVRCELQWEKVERKSGRTGQTHPLGGFTGEAEYEGSLAEFLPWLRAARWVGVGRQTVWGKGDVRVIA